MKDFSTGCIVLVYDKMIHGLPYVAWRPLKTSHKIKIEIKGGGCFILQLLVLLEQTNKVRAKPPPPSGLIIGKNTLFQKIIGWRGGECFQWLPGNIR